MLENKILQLRLIILIYTYVYVHYIGTKIKVNTLRKGKNGKKIFKGNMGRFCLKAFNRSRRIYIYEQKKQGLIIELDN